MSASAQISRISPNPVPYGSVEGFLTIFGEGIAGAVSTNVQFNGPAGEFLLEASAVSVNSVTSYIPPEIAFLAGDYTVTIFAFDGESTRTYGPASFSVAAPPAEEFPPLLFVPEFVIAEAQSNEGTVVDYEVVATSGDGSVTLTPQCSPASGSSFSLGVTNVLCTASDASGTTEAGFVVFVADSTPPVVTVPETIVSEGQVVTFTATAQDNISGSANVSCSPASGSTFPNGTTLVTCIALDSSFNAGFGFFNVIVTGGAPAVLVPDPITAEATSAGGANVDYSVSSSDDSPVTCSQASGSLFALGTTTVNCSAANSVGTGTSSFTVTVIDTTPPVVTAPDMLVPATSPAGANVTYEITAVDLVAGAVTATCTPGSGSFFAIDTTTTVACNAHDGNGNGIDFEFEVTVETIDNTPPTVTFIEVNPKVLWPPNHKMVPITVTVQATDDTDPAPTSSIVSISSNQPINGTGDGDVAPDWIITGSLTAQLRAERAGSNERIYSITVATQDAVGNTTLSTLKVRVMDSKSRSSR